jgi:hypothetical protein
MPLPNGVNQPGTQEGLCAARRRVFTLFHNSIPVTGSPHTQATTYKSAPKDFLGIYFISDLVLWFWTPGTRIPQG